MDIEALVLWKENSTLSPSFSNTLPLMSYSFLTGKRPYIKYSLPCIVPAYLAMFICMSCVHWCLNNHNHYNYSFSHGDI